MKIEEAYKLPYNDRIRLIKFLAARWDNIIVTKLIELKHANSTEDYNLFKYLSEVSSIRQSYMLETYIEHKITKYDLEFWNIIIDMIIKDSGDIKNMIQSDIDLNFPIPIK